ncbi:MAG: hypothetical protein WC683_15750 [bacterium]
MPIRTETEIRDLLERTVARQASVAPTSETGMLLHERSSILRWVLEEKGVVVRVIQEERGLCS